MVRFVIEKDQIKQYLRVVTSCFRFVNGSTEIVRFRACCQMEVRHGSICELQILIKQMSLLQCAGGTSACGRESPSRKSRIVDACRVHGKRRKFVTKEMQDSCIIFQYEYKESDQEHLSLCVLTAYRVHHQASAKSSRYDVELLAETNA